MTGTALFTPLHPVFSLCRMGASSAEGGSETSSVPGEYVERGEGRMTPEQSDARRQACNAVRLPRKRRPRLRTAQFVRLALSRSRGCVREEVEKKRQGGLLLLL